MRRSLAALAVLLPAALATPASALDYDPAYCITGKPKPNGECIEQLAYDHADVNRWEGFFGDLDGGALYQDCTIPHHNPGIAIVGQARARCRVLVATVLNMNRAAGRFLPGSQTFCPPHGTQWGEAATKIVTWIAATGPQRHAKTPAFMVALRALQTQYPCGPDH